MVSTLTWVLVGVLVYTLVATGLRARGWLPDAVRVSGPITTLHTKRGRAVLDWLARPRRLWRAYANVGVGIALVVMALSFVMILASGIVGLQQEPTQYNQPRNALVIPGVNPFIPLAVTPYVVVGLTIGLVVHEGGHGLLCRVEDIDIESMGLALLTVLPIGAFVEPNEESRLAADRGAQTRMFAAGVTNNFAVGALAILLLFGPVAGSIAVADGYPVRGAFETGPADRAGIGSGDVITAVNGTAVATPADLNRALADVQSRTLQVSLRDGREVTVARELVVAGAPAGSPIGVNATVSTVNGTAVYSVAGFREAIANRSVARLSTDRGAVTLPMGALVRVVADGPFAADGGPTGESVVVTAVDGQRTRTAGELQAILDDASPGDEVAVVAHHGDAARTYNVTLGEGDDGDALLGVLFGQAGTTGLEFSEFGVESYPAGYFLEAIGGESGGAGGIPGGLGVQLLVFLLLPFAAVIPGVGTGFAGFVGVGSNFYAVQGPLAILGAGGVFVLANVLFWTAWINVIVGQFNLIPAYPLDGGHILRASVESVVARLPVARKRAFTKVVTTSVGVLMLGGIVLALFGPYLTG